MSSTTKLMMHGALAVALTSMVVTVRAEGTQTRAMQAALEKARTDCMANMAAAIAAKTEAEPPPQPPPTTTALIAPGASAAVSIKRAYIKGVKFLLDIEGVTMSNVASANGTVSATLAVAAGHAPGYINLNVLHPIDCSWDVVPIAFINTMYRFDLKGANGWTIRAVPSAKSFDANAQMATLPYTFEFLRVNEAKPFETRPGNMRYYVDKPSGSRLDLDIFEKESDAKTELEEIMKKMGDPKLTDAQRDALGERYGKAMARMNTEMMAMMTDPNAAQKKIDDFGCRLIQAEPDGTGKLTGAMLCGKNVNNGTVQVSGTIATVK